MEHLALEIFDLEGTGSKYATLPEDTVITITDTSEIFASGDVWSHSFTLNAEANAHIFGTAADMHGSRLHDQLDRRKARLWAEGLPLYLGYIRLDGEAEVDGDGNVDVRFESGQKTFEEMIEGISAQEVSVGDDVVIGIALNRKRVAVIHDMSVSFTLDGLEAYAVKDPQLTDVRQETYGYGSKYSYGTLNGKTQYVQRWPKLVKSYGKVLDSSGSPITPDYTNVQIPYDGTEAHPFCNINICYPLKANKNGEEVAGRGYTTRLARGKETTDGGDNQTRFNNAPNFYLLYFIDHLFKDMEIHIEENQAMDVEDLRRVFLLNYGCFYEEIEDTYAAGEQNEHLTPSGKRGRYGQYYMPIIDEGNEHTLIRRWVRAGQYAYGARGLENKGKILLRNVEVKKGASTLLSVGSLEGIVMTAEMPIQGGYEEDLEALSIDRTRQEDPENGKGFYSAYKAYATGENYPKVEISEIIDAMKSMFGVRLLFNNDYSTVRIVLLRNIFRSQEVQNIECEIIAPDSKTENNIRGFRMTYGKGTEDTSFYYKGFNDTFSRAGKIWKDTSDKHDYSQWDLDADYGEIKQYVSAMNKTCYVTPLTGNAYIIKVDEDEDVLFPSLFEAAGFMDAEDGDCTRLDSESETVEEIQVSASPVIMNETGNTYASLFSGDLKAPAPETTYSESGEALSGWGDTSWLATYGRMTTESRSVTYNVGSLTVKGLLDIYVCEGFQIRLLDNYAISNGGTPFDEADPGLQFGIMRSSGDDAYVRYYDDPDDDENDAWEMQPGSGAISYPDTCDGYGNRWDYNGQNTVRTAADAVAALSRLFPDSHAAFYISGPTNGYINGASIAGPIPDNTGKMHSFLIATHRGSYIIDFGSNYIPSWIGHSVSEILAMDAAGRNIIVEVDSSWDRQDTLLTLCRIAYGNSSETVIIDDGTGTADGRFSLKLRAEKPNPLFDPTRPENDTDNRRYLEVTDPHLRGRGLMDQFYKEYSYWARNARIAKRTVQMTLAQLLAIDKTKRARVGDITGFIRKTQYQVSNKTGLGMVKMEILYI